MLLLSWANAVPSVFASVLLTHLLAATPAVAQSGDWRACRGADLDRKISSCTRIIDRGDREQAKDRAVAYNNRGYVFIERGNFDRAIRDFDEAIRLNPTYALAYQHRSIARERKGDFRGAFRDVVGVIIIDPASDYAEKALHRLDTLLSQHSENKEVVTLNPGLSKTLQSEKGFKTLVVGNSELADAIPHSERSFTLTAKQEGRTTVIALDGELNEIYSAIVVIAAPPKQIEATARDAMAQTQPKQDVLGFFLGMSEAQFMEQAAAAGCRRRYATKLVMAREECSAPDGSMVFTFTDKVEERWILKEIQFKFSSGTGPDK